MKGSLDTSDISSIAMLEAVRKGDIYSRESAQHWLELRGATGRVLAERLERFDELGPHYTGMQTDDCDRCGMPFCVCEGRR